MVCFAKKIEFLEREIQIAIEDINRWTKELIEVRKLHLACLEEQERWKKLNEGK